MPSECPICGSSVLQETGGTTRRSVSEWDKGTLILFGGVLAMLGITLCLALAWFLALRQTGRLQAKIEAARAAKTVLESRLKSPLPPAVIKPVDPTPATDSEAELRVAWNDARRDFNREIESLGDQQKLLEKYCASEFKALTAAAESEAVRFDFKRGRVPYDTLRDNLKRMVADADNNAEIKHNEYLGAKLSYERLLQTMDTAVLVKYAKFQWETLQSSKPPLEDPLNWEAGRDFYLRQYTILSQTYESVKGMVGWDEKVRQAKAAWQSEKDSLDPNLMGQQVAEELRQLMNSVARAPNALNEQTVQFYEQALASLLALERKAAKLAYAAVRQETNLPLLERHLPGEWLALQQKAAASEAEPDAKKGRNGYWACGQELKTLRNRAADRARLAEEKIHQDEIARQAAELARRAELARQEQLAKAEEQKKEMARKAQAEFLARKKTWDDLIATREPGLLEKHVGREWDALVQGVQQHSAGPDWHQNIRHLENATGQYASLVQAAQKLKRLDNPEYKGIKNFIEQETRRIRSNVNQGKKYSNSDADATLKILDDYRRKNAATFNEFQNELAQPFDALRNLVDQNRILGNAVPPGRKRPDFQ